VEACSSVPKVPYAAGTKLTESFETFIFTLAKPRISTSVDMQNIVAALPRRHEGEALLAFFFDEILWIYHLVHVPTVRRHFEKLHSDIQHNQQPEYGPLALIATIYSLVAYFSSESSGLFFKESEAMLNCHNWALL